MSTQNPISSTPQAPLTTQYDLRDAFQLLKKEIFLSLNCHAIGTVQSFQANSVPGSNPALVGQTATATVNYQRTFFKIDPVSQAYNPYLLPYPLLVDCPVICLGGGTAALTFPIQTGDECLILFNDRNIDNWFNSNINSSPATARMHSFTDAIILVGLRSIAHVISNYDTTRAVLRNGNALVGVGTEKVKIANETTTLNTLIQNLITAIKAITTLNSDSTTGVIDAVSQTNLGMIATQIEGLLE